MLSLACCNLYRLREVDSLALIFMVFVNDWDTLLHFLKRLRNPS